MRVVLELPHIAAVLGSISSGSKFEESCDALGVADSCVYESAGMLRSDVSDCTQQMQQVTVNTRQRTAFQGLHPAHCESLKMNDD